MSQHIKSLFHQLQPLLFANHSNNNNNNNNNQYTPKTGSVTKSESRSGKAQLAPKGSGSKRRKLHFGDGETPVISSDSGVDVTPSTISYNCKQCLHRLNCANELDRKLKQAHGRYVKSNLNELHFANVPMLVVKSYKPTATQSSSSPGGETRTNNKLTVRRGVPVNALFLLDNKWLYVKTTGEQKGFIPKKCCEPFADSTINHANHHRPKPKPKPKLKPAPSNDHTYATIVNTEPTTTSLSLFAVSQSKSHTVSYENLNLPAGDKVYANLGDFKSNRSCSSPFSLSEYDCLTDSPAPATATSSITTISPLDLNYFESSSSSLSSVAGPTTTTNHYDQLMRYNKVTGTSEVKMSVYRVVRSFRAHSNGYLSVTRGDLVMATAGPDETDYLLVRMLQKKAHEPVIYENVPAEVGVNERQVEIGYVPSSHLSRLNPHASSTNGYPLTSSVYSSSSSSTATSLSSRSSSPIY